jgi:hypothetical protein
MVAVTLRLSNTDPHLTSRLPQHYALKIWKRDPQASPRTQSVQTTFNILLQRTNNMQLLTFIIRGRVTDSRSSRYLNSLDITIWSQMKYHLYHSIQWMKVGHRYIGRVLVRWCRIKVRRYLVLVMYPRWCYKVQIKLCLKDNNRVDWIMGMVVDHLFCLGLKVKRECQSSFSLIRHWKPLINHWYSIKLNSSSHNKRHPKSKATFHKTLWPYLSLISKM